MLTRAQGSKTFCGQQRIDTGGEGVHNIEASTNGDN